MRFIFCIFFMFILLFAVRGIGLLEKESFLPYYINHISSITSFCRE